LIVSVGLVYLVRFYASELLVVLPFGALLLSVVFGGVFMGISYVAPSWFNVVTIRDEKGAIYLSSPLWIDILRWVSMIVLAICFIFMSTSKDQTWFGLIRNWFATAFFIIVVVMLVKKIRMDHRDEMIIANDYLSIDEEMSSDKKVIMRKDIVNIRLESYRSARQTKEYVNVTLRDLNNIESVSEYKFESIEKLNISRKVVVKHLKLKNYSVIEEV
jgi:hypothetical protein